MTSTHIIGFAAAVLLASAAPSSGTESPVAPAAEEPDTVPLHEPRLPPQTDLHSSPGHTAVLRPGPAIRLRIQSRGSDPLVHARRRARSHLRHVLLGIALAYGPHVNAPMDSASGVAAYAAAQSASAQVPPRRLSGRTSRRSRSATRRSADRSCPAGHAYRARWSGSQHLP